MSDPDNLTTRLLQLTATLTGTAPAGDLSKVETAVKSLLGEGASPVSLQSLLVGLGGITPKTLADLHDKLTAIKGDGTRSVAELLTESYFANAHLAVFGRLGDIEERLDFVQRALGAQPYDDMELVTIRSLLYSILQGQNTSLYGPLPTGTTDNQSSGTLVLSGRIYALFPGTIAGVTISEDDRELTASWGEGWSVYIQTTDPAPQIAGVVDIPNQWLELVGTGTINFSVAPGYTIRVFFRAPGVPTSPYVLYEPNAAAPATGIDPWSPASLAYAAITIPLWADRVQLRITSSNCFGQVWWHDASNVRVSVNNTLCHDTTFTLPVGARTISFAAGGESDRLTGMVWALAPGVSPAP